MRMTASAQSAAPLDLVPTQFRRTIATIMFTDVEDSTGLANVLGLIETTHFLLEHIIMVQRAVQESGGIVQNFTGDGVLALWLGTEMQPRETAIRALAAVAELSCEISVSNARRRLLELPTRRVRIGLHTGEIMFVNECQRGLSFVVGPAVNFARRVEQAGKRERVDEVETLVMVSGATLCTADLSAEVTDPHGLFHLTADRLGGLRRDL